MLDWVRTNPEQKIHHFTHFPAFFVCLSFLYVPDFHIHRIASANRLLVYILVFALQVMRISPLPVDVRSYTNLYRVEKKSELNNCAV